MNGYRTMLPVAALVWGIGYWHTVVQLERFGVDGGERMIVAARFNRATLVAEIESKLRFSCAELCGFGAELRRMS